MKGRSLLLSAVLILVAGLVLIITYKSTQTQGITIVGGVLFIVAGLLNIFSYLGEKSDKIIIESNHKDGVKTRRPSALSGFLAWTSSVATILLGLSMLVWTPVFQVWVPSLFGILVCFGALYQFYLLAFGSRPLRLPTWLFAVPVLLLFASIYLFFQKPQQNEQVIMMVTGISFVVFSLTLFIESVLIGSANRMAKRQVESKESAPEFDKNRQIEDVKALDEQ